MSVRNISPTALVGQSPPAGTTMVKQAPPAPTNSYDSLVRHPLYSAVRSTEGLDHKIMAGLSEGFVWQCPTPSLPIDEIVSCLIAPDKWGTKNSSRIPKLRGPDPREKLAERGVACPYEHARIALAAAARSANNAVDKIITNKTMEAERLENLKKYSEELMEKQRKFIEYVEECSLSLLHPPYIGWDNPIRHGRHADKVEAALWARTDRIDLEFKNIKSAMDSALYIYRKTRVRYREAKGWKPGNVWEKEFVREMGYAWFKLTGKIPGTSSDYFRRFLISAVDTIMSLCEKHKITLFWDDAIESVSKSIKDGPGWDYFEPGRDLIKLVQVDIDTEGRPLFLREDHIRRNEKVLKCAISYKNATDDAAKTQAYINLLTYFTFIPNAEGEKEIEDIIETGYYIKPKPKMPSVLRTVRKTKGA
ncbi:hypothetical protein PUR29_36840 [Methylobacterium ajmalii]|uniref:Uncharacterized protein n=1 Tax=Methylobacterium ajmalii TaxID=2738439 RepID=A0ABV0A7F7_9HYPH